MRMFVRRVMSVFAALAIGAVLTLFGFSEGRAQEKHTISLKASAANTKYTQQHIIDVGDVPGHQVRIYELHRTYPSGPPAFEGVRAVESWTRGYSDYTNLNGRAWGYTYWILENGDKIFSQYSGTTQTTVKADGSKDTVYTGVTTITGGTGKFRGIRGTSRGTAAFNPATGYNETQEEGEYWIE